MQRKAIIWSLILAITYMCFNLNYLALAKPMQAPTLEEACKSKLILIASYKGHDISLFPDYFDGVNANYQVLKVVKGVYRQKTIKINYAFQDGSACVAPKDWHLDNKLMPKENSKWILFINSTSSGVYRTYRGNFGRIELTDKNLKRVTSILKQNRNPRTTN